MISYPAENYREFLRKNQQEQEDWRWANYWIYVKAMIALPTVFLVGIAIGFALPA